MTTLTTERFAPISLDALTERAALLTRVDRKYVLTADAVTHLLETAPDSTRQLSIDGVREFDYVSDYYDTPDLACYLGAARRRRRRFKVRHRRYVQTGGAFLEVKTRRGDATVKERLAWAVPEIAGPGADFVESSLRQANLTVDTARLAPTLRTSYRRSTLFLPETGSRATLDADLTWRTPAGRSLASDAVIVETKTGSTPCAIDRLLWSQGYRPVAVSKYAVGLAALHPALPHNRWHRLLGRGALALH